VNFDDFVGPGDHVMVQAIKDTIYYAYENHPRSLQEALGPSEVGEPCARRLAYRIMREPKLNKSDPLPSIVGTAAHKWLEEACKLWNAKVGETIWIVEAELPVGADIIGHCDAYYVPRRTVVDWKFPGQEPMRDYRANGPSEVYRSQAHLYGMGWVNLGMPVDQVGIAHFPRGGNLEGRYGLLPWFEAYNPAIAEAALQRYYMITELTVALNVEEHPENYALVPASPESCHHCPQRVEGVAIGRTCPGLPKPKKEKS
jgi:hypothetical protein